MMPEDEIIHCPQVVESVEPTKPDDGRRGFALPAAIGAIVIVGVLVTAGFYMAQQEVRIGVATENAGMAFFLAEDGTADVLENWDNSVMENRTLFVDTTITGTTDQGDWTVVVRRIGTQLYFLDAMGQITEGGALYSGAQRRVGMIARHLELGIEPPAAVTTKGGISFKGSPPSLTGDDTDPPGWGSVCPGGPPQDQVGFLSNDTTGNIQPGTGKSAGYCGTYIDGDPCVDEDVPLVNETFEPFYDGEYWNYLIDIADHQLTGGVSPGPSYTGGACNTADPANWGEPNDPSDACGDYFPLIYINGNATINGNTRGQGILLVEGDLDYGGTGEYIGIIIVKGCFTAGGTPTVTGAIIAACVNVLNGTPDIIYSACAVERAITLNSNVTRARPMTRRSYVDLTNLSN